MANDPTRVREIPGRLCINPTDLTLDFPHGGEELGILRAQEFASTQESPGVEAEEFGGEVVEYFYIGEVSVFACVLRDRHPRTVELVYPGATISDKTGEAIVRPSNADGVRSGTPITKGNPLVVCFSPLNPKDPFLILRNAAPMVSDSQKLNLTKAKEHGISIMFKGVRDSSGRTPYIWARKEDITL